MYWCNGHFFIFIVDLNICQTSAFFALNTQQKQNPSWATKCGVLAVHEITQKPNNSLTPLARCAKNSEPVRHRAKWVKWGVVDNCSVPHTVTVWQLVSVNLCVCEWPCVCMCAHAKNWLYMPSQFSTDEITSSLRFREREREITSTICFLLLLHISNS